MATKDEMEMMCKGCGLFYSARFNGTQSYRFRT